MRSRDRTAAVASELVDAYHHPLSYGGAMSFRLRKLFGARFASDVPPGAYPQALALIEEGKLEQALLALRAFLAVEAGHAEAWYKQGNLLKDLNRPSEALLSYQRAIELNPRYAAAHCNRGAILLSLGKPDDALCDFRRAIEIDPHDAIAYYNCGAAEQTLHRCAAAFSSYGKAIELNPHYAEAHFSRALLHEQAARWPEALSGYEQALALRPTLTQAHFHRGNVLAQLKRWDEALSSFDLAVSANPQHALAHLHRGNTLRELRQWDAAIASYDRLIALEPDNADAHYNRAVVFELQKKFPDALLGFGRAIAVRPGFVAAEHNRALVLLQTGEFGAGFAGYEWRWASRGTGVDPAAHHDVAVPLWSGHESLEGKRILVFSEQGLGDTLQFCRYVKLLAALGANVVFEVQRPLTALLATIEGALKVIAPGEAVPPFDFKCALMSLPLAFKTTLDTIPSGRKYLHADAARVAAWQTRLGPRTRPRIGLAWSGNPHYLNDYRRSIPLAKLIDRLPREFEYFCLQKDIRAADRATLDANPFIAEPAADLLDTAALCECMDLVISSCTSIAHLAGALGRPLWILLGFNADWRWLEDRDDSPWYPTARLYRQAASGDWDGVIERVAADLPGTLTPRA
jgi:tetratricopeptide (TPR) repeat protein